MSSMVMSRRALMGGAGALCLAASWKTAWGQGARQTQQLLNGPWRFALAKTGSEAEALAAFWSPGFAAAGFQPTPVPSNWSVLGYEEPVYRGFTDDKAAEGFYLHDFDVPAGWKGKRVLLHFGGVWSSAEVWLNGKALGRHDSGYTGFSYDVSDEVLAGANRLAVRVRQVSREYKFDVFDDWTLGGVYRDVWLEMMPRARWLDSVGVETVFDDLYEDADLKLRVMVSDTHKSTLPGNYDSPGEPYDLRFTLTDQGGKEVYRRQITVPSHIATDRETRLTARIARPNPWNAETPYLYTLRVDLLEKGEVSHTRSERVGFREISTKGGVFRVNGQAVKLRGVNRHDEHPDVGRATRPEHWREDITLMKAANINFIRAAHYAHARGFIELCDEMGMYVGAEVSLGGAGGLMYDPSFNDAVMVRAQETVTRDQNSPSIVYWSVGNEDPLTTLHMVGVRLVKALDPTRPVLLPWRAEEWLPPEIDIIAPHYWKPQEYDALAARSTRPIITTEYTHAYASEGMGGLDARWKALTKHPAGAGAAVWVWADQGIATPTPKPYGDPNDKLRLTGDGLDGVVTAYRKPTRDYWEVQAVYAQVYPAVEEVAFTPGEETARIPIQNDFDFTDLKAISFDWTIREEGRELARGTASVPGGPHAEGVFLLPLAALRTVREDKTYIAAFVFRHADGREIARRAVELIPTGRAPFAARPARPLSIARAGVVTVTAGEAAYAFDPKSGELVSATLAGRPVVTALRPHLWHKLDENERNMMGGRLASSLPDLNTAVATAQSFEVGEESGEALVRAVVDYGVNAENRVTATYDYRVRADGSLQVRYSFATKVQAPWLPVVGMAVRTAPSLSRLDWLGLGPHDAWPNKRRAPMLGLWGGADAAGIKAMRRLERGGADGVVRVHNDGYFEHAADAPDWVAVLSGVVGRPEKGRKADDSIPQLETTTGRPFIGAFTIELAGPQGA